MNLVFFSVKMFYFLLPFLSYLCTPSGKKDKAKRNVMLGTIVNTCTIIIGSTVGHLAKRGIKEKYQTVMFQAMGLAALAIGFNAVANHMPKSEYPVLFIVSLALGGLLGTWLDFNGCFNRFVNSRSSRKSSESKKEPASSSLNPEIETTEQSEPKESGKGNLAQGLSTGILLYCIGTLSIVGPMISALNGDNTFLYTNATLDLITSTVLATTYGIGMIWAAPVLFCWQGAFYLVTKLAGNIIPDALVDEVILVGGILIVASGLSILRIKDCKTLNLLPALLVPILFFLIKSLF